MNEDMKIAPWTEYKNEDIKKVLAEKNCPANNILSYRASNSNELVRRKSFLSRMKIGSNTNKNKQETAAENINGPKEGFAPERETTCVSCFGKF